MKRNEGYRLDRFSNKPFKYQVFRRVDDPERRAELDPRTLGIDLSQITIDGVHYERVNPAECFVIKRKDKHALPAIRAYRASIEADREFVDAQYAADIQKLHNEWLDVTIRNNDEKMPD
jgi:hypothetical protein